MAFEQQKAWEQMLRGVAVADGGSNMSIDDMLRELGSNGPRWEDDRGWVAWGGNYDNPNVAEGAKSFNEAVVMAWRFRKAEQDEASALGGAIEGHESKDVCHLTLGQHQRRRLLQVLERLSTSRFAQWWLGMSQDEMRDLGWAQIRITRAVEAPNYRRIVEVYVRRRINAVLVAHAASMKAPE
jgi:hypothetical protein